MGRNHLQNKLQSLKGMAWEDLHHLGECHHLVVHLGDLEDHRHHGVCHLGECLVRGDLVCLHGAWVDLGCHQLGRGCASGLSTLPLMVRSIITMLRHRRVCGRNPRI